MSLHVYNLTIQWKGGSDAEKLETLFQDPILDWYRINAYSWYLAFEQSPQEVAHLIRGCIPDVTFALVAIDPANRYGWAPPAFWSWLDKYNALLKRKDKI